MGIDVIPSGAALGAVIAVALANVLRYAARHIHAGGGVER